MKQLALDIAVETNGAARAKVPARARFFAGTAPGEATRRPVTLEPEPEFVTFSGLLREVLEAAAEAGGELVPRYSLLLGACR